MDENINLVKVCRVCLAPESKKEKFTRLFGENKQLSVQFFFTTNITVMEFMDIAPALICDRCKGNLEIAYRFKKMALVADKFFNNLSLDKEAEIFREYKLDESENFYLENIQIKHEQTMRDDDIEPIQFLDSNLDQSDWNVNQYTVSNDDNFDRNDDIDSSSSDDFNDDDDDFFSQMPPKKEKSPKKEKKDPSQKRSYIRGGNKEGICDICGKNLWSEERLKNHIKVKHEIIPLTEYIPCPIEGCRKKFKIPLYVDRHIENMHSNTPKKRVQESFPCSYCGVFLGSKNALKQHENRHLIAVRGEEMLIHSCDMCGYKADKKIKVQYHIERVHLQLRKFKCKVCPADFVHASLLNYHELTVHLNLRKFSCRFNCGKSFTRSSCRTIHERIHKNERPYSCKFCERTFIHHSDHRRHELRHTGGIPAKVFDQQMKQGLAQVIHNLN
ncbi:unnamed protein product [Chironomus riparius]|uniref:C2H2-type domain-containing protein n=1 Tax=Chironomus riparius TaxID=315576 RepID=A0A9N9RVM0_9DIPT|nr:unnamed protein product [Chironomus riparius]